MVIFWHEYDHRIQEIYEIYEKLEMNHKSSTSLRISSQEYFKKTANAPLAPPPSQKGMGLYYMDPGNTWSLHRFRLFSYKANIWDCSHCLVTIVRTTWWCIFDGPIKKRLWWILKSTKMNHPTLLIWKSRVQGWSIRIMIFK